MRKYFKFKSIINFIFIVLRIVAIFTKNRVDDFVIPVIIKIIRRKLFLTPEVNMEKIDQLKKCFDLLIEGGNVAGKVYEDNKITMSDTGHLMMMLDEVTAMSGVSLSVVVAQAKDIDSAEMADLGQHLKTKFDIPQDELEQKIEEGVEVLAMLAQAGSKAYAYVKSFGAEKAVAPAA